MSWRVRWNVVPVLLPLSLVLAGRARTRPVDEATGADTVVALVGGKVYRSAGSEPIGDGIILIRNGRVAVVGGRASVRVPPEARVIDCRGLVVVPGFWNSHVHFTEEHWSGAATAPAARLSRQLREMLLRYGFVHVVDTGSWLENTLALRRRIERGEVVGPAILTIGPSFVPPGASPFYIRPAKLPELASPQEAGP